MKIADKNNSAVKMVKEALEKCEKYKDYNVFTSIDSEYALKRATEIDEKIAKGEEVGRLAGVPYALKDNFLGKRGETTASSLMLKNLQAPLNATTVRKLEDEGAIMLGRVNLDAFAHGSSTENSYFGVTKNAVDSSRVAGGSSGGSAVAVALEIVQFATGTDTGGSIRQPASFNGVYGVKPTYGAVSRFGVVPMGSSTDTIGFFAKNAKDLDLLMEVAAGMDKYDTTSLPDFYLTSAPRELKKIGVVKEFDEGILSEDVQTVFHEYLEKLEEDGYEIIELSMPILKYALAVYYMVVSAEIASNLARHDGVRYGYRSESAKTLGELYKNSRAEGFMPENKRRIMIGNFVFAKENFEKYYLKAQKVRTLIIEAYAKAFEECDAILSPVTPNTAFKIGEKAGDPLAMYLEDMMSTPINLAGLPAVAFPAGTTAEGLPVGLQLIGPRRDDKSLITTIDKWSKTC